MSLNCYRQSVYTDTPAVCRVLVVACHEELRNSLHAALYHPDFAEHMYSDFLHAVAEFVTFRPDIVILEDELPRIDGWQSSLLIGRKYKLPVIITGHCHPNDGWPSAVRAGAEHYLKYPFSGEELRARIKAILRRYQKFDGAGARPYLTRAATTARI